jgi:hypothetical protein
MILSRRNITIVSLTSFILLITYVFNSKYFVISTTNSVFSTLSPVFWILILLNYISIYMISKYIKNNYLLLALIIFYNFLLYSTNLFFTVPFQQTDINTTTRWTELLKKTNLIGINLTSIDNYFEWPIYFIVNKIIILFFNTDVFTTINIGYYLFLFLLPIMITLLLLTCKVDIKEILYMFPVYMLLSYNFIVLQFAPQTLAYLYFIIVLTLYIKNRDNNTSPFIILVYITLIFVHPFFFIFFIAMAGIDIILLNTKQQRNNKKLFIFLSGVYLVCYILIFHSITSDVIYLFDNLGVFKSGVWTMIGNIFGMAAQFNPNPYTPYPLYYLFDANLQFILSTTSRLILLTFLLLFIINLVFMAREKNILKIIKTFDISNLISTMGIYVVGLFTVFLGGRSIQVATISISKVYQYLLNRSRIYKIIFLLIIIVTPIVFQSTAIGNEIISGSRAIKDYEMESVGKFIDNYGDNNQHILVSNSGYPTGYPTNSTIYYTDPALFGYITVTNVTSNMDIIVYTPKMEMQAQYYGLKKLYRENIINNNILFNDSYTICIKSLRVVK